MSALQRRRERAAEYLGVYLFLVSSFVIYSLGASYFFNTVLNGNGLVGLHLVLFLLSAGLPLIVFLSAFYERSWLSVPWPLTLLLVLICTLGGITRWGGFVPEPPYFTCLLFVLAVWFLYRLFFQLYTGRAMNSLAWYFLPMWSSRGPDVPVTRSYMPFFYWTSVAFSSLTVIFFTYVLYLVVR